MSDLAGITRVFALTAAVILFFGPLQVRADSIDQCIMHQLKVAGLATNAENDPVRAEAVNEFARTMRTELEKVPPENRERVLEAFYRTHVPILHPAWAYGARGVFSDRWHEIAIHEDVVGKLEALIILDHEGDHLIRSVIRDSKPKPTFVKSIARKYVPRSWTKELEENAFSKQYQLTSRLLSISKGGRNLADALIDELNVPNELRPLLIRIFESIKVKENNKMYFSEEAKVYGEIASNPKLADDLEKFMKKAIASNLYSFFVPKNITEEEFVRVSLSSKAYRLQIRFEYAQTPMMYAATIATMGAILYEWKSMDHAEAKAPQKSRVK